MTPQQIKENWHRVANQLSKETDTEKVIQLAHELNRLLREPQTVSADIPANKKRK